MAIIYIVIFVLIFWGIKWHKEWNHNYLSKGQCNSIKGVFILFVFARHIVSYMIKNGYTPLGCLDTIYFKIDHYIGQLLVAMFLFYSGYGVTESIKSKGLQYIKSIPKKRIAKTLLNFDVAVLVFCMIDILINIDISVKQVLLSLVAWDSVGNSNWYIFAILLCYSLTYICNSFSKPNSRKSVIYFITLILLIIFFLSFFKAPWWYNTLLCYPAGMIFSKNKERIEKAIKSHFILYGLFFFVNIFNCT